MDHSTQLCLISSSDRTTRTNHTSSAFFLPSKQRKCVFVSEVGDFVISREFWAGWQVHATGIAVDPADGLSFEAHSSTLAEISINLSQAHYRFCVTKSGRALIVCYSALPQRVFRSGEWVRSWWSMIACCVQASFKWQRSISDFSHISFALWF